MSKAYITDSNGETEEIDYSCNGQDNIWCENCGEVTSHQLTGVSNTRGRLWTCISCNKEHTND